MTLAERLAAEAKDWDGVTLATLGQSECRRLHALLDEAAVALSGRGWLPIESAPKDGTRLAIRFKSGNAHEATWRTTYGGEWHVDDMHYLPWADQENIELWRTIQDAST